MSNHGRMELSIICILGQSDIENQDFDGSWIVMMMMMMMTMMIMMIDGNDDVSESTRPDVNELERRRSLSLFPPSASRLLLCHHDEHLIWITMKMMVIINVIFEL